VLIGNSSFNEIPAVMGGPPAAVPPGVSARLDGAYT
jgi:hypothetical protein